MSDYFKAIGRRKVASANVRIKPGKGKITVNGKDANEYFASSSLLLNEISKPFVSLDKVDKYDVEAKVQGGGHKGQAEAIRLGISKSLAGIGDEFKSTLRRADLLGRDPRKKERKKFGLKGARKQRQFTKR